MKRLFLITISLIFMSQGMLISQHINSGYIRVGNDSLFYEDSGKGETIVFIHDGLIHREVYDAQFSYFSKNYSVIRYDRRGYGKSSPAKGTYSNLEDLEFLFSQLGIDSACLVGASSGGRLAIDFTLKHPEKVIKLILVGAVVRGFPYSKHFFTRGGHLPPNLTNNEQIDMYYAAEDPYEIYRENKEATEKAIELVRQNPRRIYNREVPVEEDMPAYRRLGEIHVPALILAGEFDIPDVHAHAGAIQAGISGSERSIIPGSGHLIPLEQPDLFNEAMESFLREED